MLKFLKCCLIKTQTFKINTADIMSCFYIFPMTNFDKTNFAVGLHQNAHQNVNPLGQSEFLLIIKMTLSDYANRLAYHDSSMTCPFIIIHSWITLLIFTMNILIFCIRYHMNFHIQVQNNFQFHHVG